MNVNITVDKKDLPKYIRDRHGREFKLCLVVDNYTGKASYRYIQYKFTTSENFKRFLFGTV
jgi:hypothetical protein